MYNQFVNFLKKHRVFSEFKRSFMKFRKDTDTSIESFCDQESPSDYFIRAFPWIESNKNYDFWNNIDNKWKETL